MSIQEIEKAIEKLPAAELTQLVAWLAEHHHVVWDRQIEDDLENGRLDNLLSEVENEYQSGLARPL